MLIFNGFSNGNSFKNEIEKLINDRVIVDDDTEVVELPKKITEPKIIL